MKYPTVRYFSYGNLRVGVMNCFHNSNLPRVCQTALGDFLKLIPIVYKVESLVVLGDTAADALFMEIVDRCEIKDISVGCDSEYDKLGQFIQYIAKPTTVNKGSLFNRYFSYNANKEVLERVRDGPDGL